MFRPLSAIALATLACLLCACGGGGGNDTTEPATTYPAPPLGQIVDYAVTDTDNSQNKIAWTLEYKVLSSSPDGSFTQSAIGDGTATINGTRYGTENQVDEYNASHELLSYTVAGATPVVCTYAAGLPPLPNLATGVAWPSIVDDISCDNGNRYQVTRDDGSEIGTESVTVPAGTFGTKKEQYQFISAVPGSSEATTEEVTIWYDVASGRKVQQTVDYAYAGYTFSSGYRTHELQQLLTAP